MTKIELTKRELQTIVAALLYWQEEMSPQSQAIARPYFGKGDSRCRPLSADEITDLRERLRRRMM